MFHYCNDMPGYCLFPIYKLYHAFRRKPYGRKVLYLNFPPVNEYWRYVVNVLMYITDNDNLSLL
jgi:hypothetical protein